MSATKINDKIQGQPEMTAMGIVGTKGKTFTAFAGLKIIASGALKHVAQTTKKAIDDGETDFVLIFDDATAQPIEVDFRGTLKDVVSRIDESTRADRTKLDTDSKDADAARDGDSRHDDSNRGPGRPKLGVVSREVTLLPRHWEWLNSQPGGASVALRKLVDEARHTNTGKEAIRQSQEAAYRFMSAMAGNLPGFEESARALFAGNVLKFTEHTREWPADIYKYSRKLADVALHQGSHK